MDKRPVPSCHTGSHGAIASACGLPAGAGVLVLPLARPPRGQALHLFSKEYNTAYPAYKVAVAKSNLWPGAYAAIAKSGDKHASIYLGYGHKNDGKPFTPKASPPVLPESKEVEEAEEAALAAENALLKQIDEAKNVASNSAGDAPEE